jgi:hypothetical protein
LRTEEARLVDDLDAYEQAGRFIEAETVAVKLRDLRANIARLENTASQVEYDRKVAELQEKHKVELTTLDATWAQRMLDFESQSQRVIAAAKERLKIEYDEAEKTFQTKAEAAPQKVSGKILSMKKQLDLLVKNRDYLGANTMRKRIEDAERAEANRINSSFNDLLRRKMQAVQKKHELEMLALRQRLDNSREDLRRQRSEEKERMMKAQQIARIELHRAREGKA